MNNTNVIVVSGEGHGIGKTVFAINCLTFLLYSGYKVASVDLDSQKCSLTNYVNDRDKNNTKSLCMPKHFLISDSFQKNPEHKILQEKMALEDVLDSLLGRVDYIVIDTFDPGSYISKLAHSYGNFIVTPISCNSEGLLSIARIREKDDVLALSQNTNSQLYSPSSYSQLVWEQKMVKIKRDRSHINWFVLKNKFNTEYENQSSQIDGVLKILSKKFGFTVINGLKHRALFHELSLRGLTVMDVKSDFLKNLTIPQIVARQELKHLMSFILR